MSWLTFFYEEPILIHLGTWISVGDIQINYGLLLDSLSMTVMVPVGIVTLCVLFYALDYMKHDPNRNRFYIILSVFAIFMTILVISENYVMMFIGWEFVGVVSYLLISFWNTRIAAMKSALSAILLNRMGDTLFVICIGCMISYFHAVDFETIELISPHVDTLLLNSLAIMLLIAATAKSAQLGLHGWLLSAMEGIARNNQPLKRLIPQLNPLLHRGSHFLNGHIKQLIIPPVGAIIKYSTSHKEWKRTKDGGNYIWVYDINTLELINNEPYISKSECSRDLNITRGTIRKYIDDNKLYKYKYIFSYKELSKDELLLYNNNINKISPKLLEIITGELLGDGHIRKSTNNSARLEFTFSSKILYYINYLKFNALSEICTDTPPTPWPKDDPTQYWFGSISLPVLNDLHKQWYICPPEGGRNKNNTSSNKYIKILPNNIYDLLTARSIAHWLMGDGYFDNDKQTIFFCTDCFSLNEVETLINILNHKFNIKSTLHPRKYIDKYLNNIIHYRIKLDRLDLDKFINLVKPYMIPEMYYKLDINS